ncbi:MAG: enoyl-CoA hydratase-related protein [Negativicutes bacterium]|nr:enoyl-CoA hydratase-related protein [Negativicutes bacterium]
MLERKYFLGEIKNGVALITINRPRILNILDLDVLAELVEILDELQDEDSAKILVLTGAGEKAFCAGDDVKPMLYLDAKQARQWVNLGQQTLHKIEEYEKPVIAAINGYAVGGGLELALACDIRVASEKAKFGVPEVKLGVTVSFGGAQRMPRLIGPGMAKYLTMSGKIIDAQEAYRIGLVEFLTPHEQLMDTVMKIAGEITEKSQTAVQLQKAVVNHGQDMDIRTACRYEAYLMATCYATEDQLEGMTAFVEKRPPVFTGKYRKNEKL